MPSTAIPYPIRPYLVPQTPPLRNLDQIFYRLLITASHSPTHSLIVPLCRTNYVHTAPQSLILHTLTRSGLKSQKKTQRTTLSHTATYWWYQRSMCKSSTLSITWIFFFTSSWQHWILYVSLQHAPFKFLDVSNDLYITRVCKNWAVFK